MSENINNITSSSMLSLNADQTVGVSMYDLNETGGVLFDEPESSALDGDNIDEISLTSTTSSSEQNVNVEDVIAYATQVETYNDNFNAKYNEALSAQNTFDIDLKAFNDASLAFENAKSITRSAKTELDEAQSELDTINFNINFANSVKDMSVLSPNQFQNVLDGFIQQRAQIEAKVESLTKKYEDALKDEEDKKNKCDEACTKANSSLESWKSAANECNAIKSEYEAYESSHPDEKAAYESGDYSTIIKETLDAQSDEDQTSEGSNNPGVVDLAPMNENLDSAINQLNSITNNNGINPEEPKTPDELSDLEKLKLPEESKEQFKETCNILGVDPEEVVNNLLNMSVDELAQKIADGDITAQELNKKVTETAKTEQVVQSFSKGGEAAKIDNVSFDEFKEVSSELQDVYTDTVAIFENDDFQVASMADKFNYDKAGKIASNLNSGAYEDIDLLQEVTSDLQDIDFVKTSEVNSGKAESYCDDMLDTLRRHISDEQGAEFTQQSYDAIESEFNTKFSSDPEGAYKFLMDELRKQGVYEVVGDE